MIGRCSLSGRKNLAAIVEEVTINTTRAVAIEEEGDVDVSGLETCRWVIGISGRSPNGTWYERRLHSCAQFSRNMKIRTAGMTALMLESLFRRSERMERTKR